MAKKEQQISNKDFLVAELRRLASSGDEDGVSLSIRLGALDRLAAVLGAYKVVEGFRE